MKGILLDLSKKVDQTIVEAVAAVSSVAEQLDVPILIVGAAARDFWAETWRTSPINLQPSGLQKSCFASKTRMEHCAWSWI